MNMEYQSFLYKTLKWLAHEKRIHLCIHDTSGILHNNSLLELPFKNKIHGSKFCDIAKTSAAGMRTCLKCKTCSIRKAMCLKIAYTGHCYLGITEIVKPVYYNDKLVCVIYLGNLMVEDNKPQIIERISRICAITGVNSRSLIKALDTVEVASENRIKEYVEICEILHELIILTLNDYTRIKGKTGISSPVYRNTNHWVIQSVQNYISAYYNRDIRLSHLAKLYFLNPQYLCRLFKNEIGTTFSDYINEVRINQAKHHLTLTVDRIVDISLQVGYNNVTYFNRLFKKYTRMTPGEYRSSFLNRADK